MIYVSHLSQSPVICFMACLFDHIAQVLYPVAAGSIICILFTDHLMPCFAQFLTLCRSFLLNDIFYSLLPWLYQLLWILSHIKRLFDLETNNFNSNSEVEAETSLLISFFTKYLGTCLKLVSNVLSMSQPLYQLAHTSAEVMFILLDLVSAIVQVASEVKPMLSVVRGIVCKLYQLWLHETKPYS